MLPTAFRAVLSVVILACSVCSVAVADTTAPVKKALLFSTESPALQAVVQQIQTAEAVPYENLSPESDYFVRIAPRKYVLDAGNKLLDSAILGTKPFVFFTIPQGIYGKSLLDIYLDIGYEAEDIIRWQRDVEMVAIVFRYPESITRSSVLDGQLDAALWQTQVYVPTWDNIFTLFDKLTMTAAVVPNKGSDYAPEYFVFGDVLEKNFILSFPTVGKERLKAVPYSALEATGGSDWAYRQLLERKLSIFEHFRGNGRTLNEIVDPKGVKHEAGIFEFVGPNSRLLDLPEVAVVALGTMKIAELFPTLAVEPVAAQ